MDLNEENLKSIINSIPGNVFFKDTQCRYLYASHLCFIIGKTDPEVQVQKELGEMFYREDCELLKSGGEMEYVSQMQFGNDTYYYKIRNKAVHGAGNTVRSKHFISFKGDFTTSLKSV